MKSYDDCPGDAEMRAAVKIADWLAVSSERQSYLAAREIESLDAVAAIIAAEYAAAPAASQGGMTAEREAEIRAQVGGFSPHDIHVRCMLHDLLSEIDRLRSHAPRPDDSALVEALSNLLNCVDGQHDYEWLQRCKDEAKAALAARRPGGEEG
jgi:hypothetical protein